MPARQRNELIAGLFVTAALAAALGVVLWLGAADALRRGRNQAVFCAKESAGSLGLRVGNFVQVNDCVVGKIVAIRSDPAQGRTLYVAALDDPALTIHADGKAGIAAGLVGDRQLVILHRGSDREPAADADHPVEITGGLDQAIADLARAAGSLREMSDVMKEVITLNRQNIDEIIDNITRVSANLRATSADIRRNPWRLTYRPPPGELHSQNIADAARAFCEGAEQLDQAAAKLRALPPNVRNDDEQVRAIRQELEQTFTRFSTAEQALWKELARSK